jgi:hypothetical protein
MSDAVGTVTPMTDTPWEPPLAGSEAAHLTGALDRLRTTFRFKADGLDAAGLNHTIGASSLTLGGLLKHLALVEDYYLPARLDGKREGDWWAAADWKADPDWEFTSAAADSPESLYALYDDAVARSRAKLAAFLAANPDPGQPIAMAWPTGEHANLRRALCDVIEEYGRHTGHADLLRESVDGVVGEDPPPGWRPRSGHYAFS